MKQLRNKMLLFIGAPLLLLAAKGHAQQSTALSDFTGIKATGNVHIEVFQADRHSIYIEDNQKAESTNLKFHVENGTLYIDNHDPKTGNANTKVYVKVYFKNLNALDLGGAVTVEGNGRLETNRMKIKSSGAAHINMELATEETKITAEGASDITLKGKSTSLNIDLVGASNVKAGDLAAQTVTISAEGGSSAKVDASESLTVKADGASSIRYAGEPKKRNIVVNGVASVKKAL